MKRNSIADGSRRSGGFTLIELMVAVAIMAILLSIAVPSFQDTIRSSQIVSQTNALLTAMTLARSEAVKRGTKIAVCSRNSAKCAGGTDWSNGWIVFVDADGDADLGAGEITLQVSPTLPAGISIVSTQPAVTFQSNGENLTATTFDITKMGCGAKQKRQLSVNPSGHTAVAKQDCP